MRKNRSQHVHCECHDKGHPKEDCPQDKNGGKNGECQCTSITSTVVIVLEPHTCCCQHGSRCTCSLKKEHLESVPEDLPHHLLPPKESTKPKLSNMNSHESKATVFTNGHHKPVHKFNDAHNHCGTPYKIPSRSHTIHGHREIAQRSTDNLLLTKMSKPHQESPLHNSMTSTADAVRKVKSEHNSPLLGPTSAPMIDSTADFTIPTFDPNAYSYSPFGSESPATQPGSQQDLTLPERFPDSWFMTYEQAHEYEPPLAAGLDAPPVDWASFNFDSSNTNSPYFDTPVNGSNFGSNQNPFSSFEQFNHLTQALANSSGEISEVEDVSANRPGNFRTTSQDASNDFSSIGGDDSSERYRLSSASSYYGTPQANMLANDNIGTLDIDDYLRQAEAETKKMQLQNQQKLQQMQLQQQVQQQLQQIQTPSPQPTPPQQSISNPNRSLSPGSMIGGEHPYTIHEAQKYAHMNDKMLQDHPLQKSAMPPTSMAEDPMWSQAPDMSNPTLSLDDAQEDEDWVR